MEEIKKAYKNLSPIYGIPENFFERKLRKKALDMLDIKKTDKVLEIGCATGCGLLGISKRTNKVYGIDLTPEMVKQAKKRNKKATIKEGDATKLNFKDNFFDKVYISNVLELLNEKEKKKALKEIKRVLRKNGKICIVDTKDSNSIIIKLYKFLHKLFPSYTSTPLNMKKTLKDFKNVKTDSENIFGIYPMGIGVGSV
ncbi:class I SAM-dependent methyltransferase [Candidatus Pacearchaeota archaeon]|nr:class I SAM-dependent methyltransferase [Candidatus Pacearchaeota archaeon]